VRGHRRTLLLGAAALAAALPVAAGCGGGEESRTAVATTRVAMPKSYVFEPERITVEAGATVTWTNEDNFTHTVQVDGQPDHEVGRGESVSIRFPRPGTYHYTCTLHPHDMDGEVVVG
jgi:plastocyanin